MASCPSCGRELAVGTRAMHACPHCGRPLPPTPAASPEAPPPPPWPAESTPADPDPLSGWDAAPRGPVTTPVSDGVVVASSALVGALVGALVAAATGTGAARGGLAGAVVGGGLAATVRRIWTIDPPDAGWAERVNAGRQAREQWHADTAATSSST